MFTRAMRSRSGSWRFRVAVTVMCATSIAVACGGPSQVVKGGTGSPSVTESASATTSLAPVAVTEPSTPSQEATSQATSSVAPADQGFAPLYRAITMVIDTPDHGPRLCLGGEKDSAPPICGDVPVVGLDWNTVSGESTIGGVTWIGQVLVTGTFDGAALTLTEPPRLATPAERTAQHPGNGPMPCPKPAGGWAAQGAGFAAGSSFNDYISRMSPLASSQPDFGGMWLAFIGDSATFDIDQHPEKVIPVVLFTGDVARHEAELRAVWPGALCVASSAMTAEQMRAIADKVTADEQGPDSLDPLLRGSAEVDSSRGTIRVYVAAVTTSLQAAFDQRYGAGVVVLRGALQPVTSN